MKIISLQSVGLATSEQNLNDGSVYSDTLCIMVGHPCMENWYSLLKHKEVHDDTDVVEIILVGPSKFLPAFNDNTTGVPAVHRQYEVELKNGHIMVLPADKYIAEYAPDEDGDEK